MASAGVLFAGIAGFAAYLYGPTAHGALTKFGVFRELASSPLESPADLVPIADTYHCEDLHYYAPTHTLFTACEGAPTSALRFQWFPPLAAFGDPDAAWQARGSIHTIDPETKLSKRLVFENFDQTFITHGIDVIPDPATAETEAVYLLAINHVPNEAVFPRDGTKPDADPGTTPKAASRIEVFHHHLGSDTVRHVRTIAHPLIRTPNDVYAISPTELYVTNDHYYADGYLRVVEDLWPGATWSNVIHAAVAADGSVRAEVAADKIHNPNGLGHGRTKDEILLASAVGGRFWIAHADTVDRAKLVLGERIELDSAVDNPTWFADPYADDAHGDASGYVLGGLARAVDLRKTAADPQGREGVVVWHVTPSKNETGKWDKTLLWQDDGSNIRNAATALLVGIDPRKEKGQKKAWLYVSGFSSEHTVAVKVHLS